MAIRSLFSISITSTIVGIEKRDRIAMGVTNTKGLACAPLTTIYNHYDLICQCVRGTTVS
jgi:hypothetical protein